MDSRTVLYYNVVEETTPSQGFEWMFLSDYENLINKSKNSSLTDHD